MNWRKICNNILKWLFYAYELTFFTFWIYHDLCQIFYKLPQSKILKVPKECRCLDQVWKCDSSIYNCLAVFYPIRLRHVMLVTVLTSYKWNKTTVAKQPNSLISVMSRRHLKSLISHASKHIGACKKFTLKYHQQNTDSTKCRNKLLWVPPNSSVILIPI